MTLHPRSFTELCIRVSYKLSSYLSGHSHSHAKGTLASKLWEREFSCSNGHRPDSLLITSMLYLNWPSAGLRGVPSRISVRWISDPFCPYQERGRRSFGSMRKWRNSRPDSQMVSELSERQHPWKRTDVRYIYTFTMGTDCWASDTHTAFPAVHTASRTRGTQTACGFAIPTVNKETQLLKDTCVHATTHTKHNMLYYNIFCQNFMLKYQGMPWKSPSNKNATSRFGFAHQEYHG